MFERRSQDLWTQSREPGNKQTNNTVGTAFLCRKLFLTRYVMRGVRVLPHAVDRTIGRRMVLLYTNLIGPSIEYKDNMDSRVVKTFLVQTLSGVNNHVFSQSDRRIMLQNESVRQMTFWLKFNTGELITPGYPIYLDMRVEKISSVQ
eukprot:scpid42051/ scgid24787/ 